MREKGEWKGRREILRKERQAYLGWLPNFFQFHCPISFNSHMWAQNDLHINLGKKKKFDDGLEAIRNRALKGRMVFCQILQ